MEVRSINGLVQIRRGADKLPLTEGYVLEKNDVLLVGPNSSALVEDQFGKVILFEESSQAVVNDLVDISGIEPLNLQAEESLLVAQNAEAAHSSFLGLESLGGSLGGLSGGAGSVIAAGGATAAGAFVVGSVSDSIPEGDALLINPEILDSETSTELNRSETTDISPDSPVATTDLLGVLAKGADTAPEGVLLLDNIGDIVSTLLYGRDPGDIEGVGGLLVGVGDALELTFGDIPVLQGVTGTLASIIRNESPQESPIADLFSFGFREQLEGEGTSSISSNVASNPLEGFTEFLPKFD